ncbi:LysR family transcriptional regulator [Acinetobacter bereziniae]|uniref:LysR family transcriptional regulator n=1 Tax=Acinetobacter bereziniae TaxID=106648 RepID=UPI00124F8D0D|nr:LysR family transcriptional regulator [Acinetobacter bereziniae]
MDKLDCINTFISVVEHGNFSSASRHLGITRDQVAKRICHLETIFNTALFIRNTRKMDLTHSGEKFYQHSKVIMSEFEWATSDFVHDQKYPEGKLRINAPHSFRQANLTEIISKFMTQYPNIKIDLFLSDKFLNINENKYDIVLRISSEIDERNTHLLSTYHRHFYATSSYLEKYGKPHTLDELKQHSLLLYSQADSSAKIVLSKNKKEESIYCTPKLSCNSGDFLLDFCKQDQGIIFLPDFLAQKDQEAGKIVRCLEDYDSAQLYFYAITSSKHKMAKKVRLFLDELKAYFPNTKKTAQL